MTDTELADALLTVPLRYHDEREIRDAAAQRLREEARDHEAMEALRFASLKKGWKWQWDGMDLQQVTLGPNAPNTHKDPADAVLADRKEGDG